MSGGISTRLMAWWRWLGITWPLADFSIGALVGVLVDVVNGPYPVDYPVPSWLGYGVSFVGVGLWGRFLNSTIERDFPGDQQ